MLAWFVGGCWGCPGGVAGRWAEPEGPRGGGEQRVEGISDTEGFFRNGAPRGVWVRPAAALLWSSCAPEREPGAS